MMMSFVRQLIRLLVVSLMAGECFAQMPSAGDQLLEQINSLSDIRSANQPFQLEADFTIQLTTPQSGHLSWKWSAKDLWRQEITMGSFSEAQVRNGDSLFTSRNISFTPMHIFELQGLLSVSSIHPDQWQVKKAKQHGQEGSEECLELRSVPSRLHGWKRQVCIDRASKDLLSDELQSESELRRKEFGDYQPFGDHRYPHTLKLAIDGSTVVKVTVRSLEAKSFDAALFTPPPNAVVRLACENIVPPVAIKTPDPSYPPSALQSRVTGTSVVSLTVLADGSVDNVSLIGSSTRDMDAVTQQIVKTWKFKPAMCGDVPVLADIEVRVNFRLH